MGDTATINIKTDRDLKRQAEELFNALGLNMTTALNVFLRQAVREKRIPFSISLDSVNDLTRNTIEKAQKGEDLSPVFSNTDELFESLE